MESLIPQIIIFTPEEERILDQIHDELAPITEASALAAAAERAGLPKWQVMEAARQAAIAKTAELERAERRRERDKPKQDRHNSRRARRKDEGVHRA